VSQAQISGDLSGLSVTDKPKGGRPKDEPKADAQGPSARPTAARQLASDRRMVASTPDLAVLG
jgi:hypothetical protein